MQLNELNSIRRNKKRVGRGGKRGTTSGRGTKGQKSRSGHVIRPAERDLILKLPKKRGFRNKIKDEAACVVGLGSLAKGLTGRKLSGKILVDRELLREIGLVGKRFRGGVKLLSSGEISFPVTLSKSIMASNGAKEKIKAAGGTIEE